MTNSTLLNALTAIEHLYHCNCSFLKPVFLFLQHCVSDIDILLAFLHLLHYLTSAFTNFTVLCMEFNLEN